MQEHLEGSQTYCIPLPDPSQSSRKVSLDDFDQTLNINLRASFILTKALVVPMREQKWGRIVFVSSIAGYGGGINGPHYAASKGGLTGLMKNLSTRLAEYSISV